MARLLYADPQLYDAQYHTLTRDSRFYVKLAARTREPVLELGIGSGRVAGEILKSGVALVGIDSSVEMLRAAQGGLASHGNRLRLIQADYSNFRLKETFRLVYSPFNGFQHVASAEALLGAFRCARAAVSEKGIFAFDIFHPTADWLEPRRSAILRESFYDETRSEGCEVWETSDFDSTHRVKDCHWEYRWKSGLSVTRNLKIRACMPLEIQECLQKADFKILNQYGDFEGSPFNQSSSKQVYVCAGV